MVAAPWTIFSPLGARHVITDANDLKVLAKANGLINKSYTNELKSLVDLNGSKPLASLPQHRKGFQLRERMRWLVHIESGEVVPLLGGDGHTFISNFKDWCNTNLPGLEGGRLNEFAGKGWFFSNGFQQHVLCTKWRLQETPPVDADAAVASFVRQASVQGEIALPDYGANTSSNLARIDPDPDGELLQVHCSGL
jgi:hypothetical protein